MASAFWGGFAKTVLGNMQEAEQRKSALEDYKTKKGIDLEFETTEVEDVNKNGQPVLRKINGKGEVVGERLLTQSEAEARMLKKREALAKVSGAEADATVKGKEAANYDADRKAELEDKALGRDLQRGNLEVARQNARSLEQQRRDSAENQAAIRQERADAAREKKDNNSAATFAATQLHEATNRIANAPGFTPEIRNRVISNLRTKIQVIVDNPNVPDNQKKLDIQKLLDTALVHVPQYARPGQPTDGSSLESFGVPK